MPFFLFFIFLWKFSLIIIFYYFVFHSFILCRFINDKLFFVVCVRDCNNDNNDDNFILHSKRDKRNLIKMNNDINFMAFYFPFCDELIMRWAHLHFLLNFFKNNIEHWRETNDPINVKVYFNFTFHCWWDESLVDGHAKLFQWFMM